MPDTRTVTIELTASEVAMLIEALDSHEYWQLSDPTWRNSGYVILPGEDVPLPSGGESPDADQRQAVAAIVEARRLQERLRAALR